ncbi:PqqD family protein [Candidatus Poribacteria bacterium]|nr:PqqD family protein [Candidatus Poribacteria bacterium]
MIQKPGMYPWIDVKELGEEAQGEAIIYNYARGEVHRINATALEVLKMCDGKHTAEEIAGKLAEIYDVDLDIAKEDVRELINRFAELELVQEGEFPG